MVKAHSALLRGDRPDTPRAWLFRIVRNTALNERRDAARTSTSTRASTASSSRWRLRTAAVSCRSSWSRWATCRARSGRRSSSGSWRAKDTTRSRPTSRSHPERSAKLIFRARSALRAGLGALLPMQLLRAAMLSGATEPGKLRGRRRRRDRCEGRAQCVAHHRRPGRRDPCGQGSRGGHRPPADHRREGSGPRTRQRHPLAPACKSAGTTHRRRVIVTPKTASPRQTAATPSQAPARSPDAHQGGTGTQGASSPPPTGSGGAGGTDGGHDGGSGGAQNYSAPRSKDCPNGGRDPGPGGVSPG
jgi:hypothetical protein